MGGRHRRSFVQVPMLQKPYKMFGSELARALQHNLPRFSVPPASADSNATYIHPRPLFRLWMEADDAVSPNLPHPASISYFILQDIICDIIDIYEVNRKECARYLVGLYNNFEIATFADARPPRVPVLGPDGQPISSADGDVVMVDGMGAASMTSASGIDGEMTMLLDEDSKSGWRMYDVIVEHLFGQMLCLPSPPYRQVYYAAALAELCKADHERFPGVLARAVDTVFRRVHLMDVECVYRLWTWFSHHLSNFGFVWNWRDWDFALTLPLLHPQACLIRETLEKDIRLSYFERIKTTLPDEFLSMIPGEPPGTAFKYQSEDHPLHGSAKLLLEQLRQKVPGAEIEERVLRDVKKKADEKGVSIPEQEDTAREVLVQCVLLLGSKSFSHVLNVVERYLSVLQSLNTTAEARLHTVKIVASFWRNNTQFLGILLDKLLNYRVVDPVSVIAWIFEQEQIENFGRSFLWEILKNTLNKVISRVAQIKSKLEAAQHTYDENEARRNRTNRTVDDVDAKQRDLDTIKAVEISLQSVTREQKEVFMGVFTRFVQLLQNMLHGFQVRGADPNMDWTYWWAYGWFIEVMRMYNQEIATFLVTLESVVFTDQIDPRILSVWKEVKILVDRKNVEVVIR
ncbi:hypothetical protein BC936DRAFT_141787 [Jimgerdemannia flammicorona]|uniref:MIF4G like-domain-containing protein n=1 Tax=Jimgerdemannia flammicorona TaxID=994334 RepID=A0A433DFY7_9FUNG|nr:hypothetical protein BC936DRAFT_141787 [Jimgerdemannia flammicorona]